MPTLSVKIEFEAFHHDGRGIAANKFIALMAIQTGEVEAIVVNGLPGNRAFIRLASATSDVGVSDNDFDTWAAGAFRSAVRFLERRSKETFAGLKKAGLADVRVCVNVLYAGEYPIIDWPSELYAMCRHHEVGLVSTWESPEGSRQAE